MYNRITFNCDGTITKGILLGEFDFVEPVTDVIEKKKFWLFLYRKKGNKNIKTKKYIVFIPFKHKLKSIVFIDEKQIINIKYSAQDEFINVNSFISKFTKEAPYYAEYKIENFKGYKFIYDDNEFIANIINELSQYSLETLYKSLPSILEEEFDEDKV